VLFARDLSGQCTDGASQQRNTTKIKQRRALSGPLTRREATACVLERATLMAETPSFGCMLAVREEATDCSQAIANVIVSADAVHFLEAASTHAGGAEGVRPLHSDQGRLRRRRRRRRQRAGERKSDS